MRARFVFLLVLLLGSTVCIPSGVAARGDTAPAAAVRLLRRTQHFDVYLADGSLRRAEALRLVERLEPTLATVSKRFGTTFKAREKLYFHPPQRGACAVRGLTYSHLRTIRLFYGPGSDLDRIQAILAHEFVHQLQRERFGDRVHQAADNILIEGWAMVASDDYARTPDGSEPRWRARLRDVVAKDQLLPLATDLEQDCRTTTRNSIYDQWASFVDYLMQQYGAEKLAELYRAGKGRRAGTADYQSVTGLPLEAIEAAWREWVKTQ